MTGSVPALDATTPDYTGNWGESLGVNSGDPDTTILGQSFTTISFTLTGKPSTGLRAVVSVGTTDYCSPITTGALTLTSFSTTCYDTAKPGTALTAADVKNITKVSVQVTSTTTAITVTDLCLTGITFGP